MSSSICQLVWTPTFPESTLWPWPRSSCGRRESRPLSLPRSLRLPTRHCTPGLVLLYPREPSCQETRTKVESEEACTRSSCSEVCAVRKTAAAALFIKGRVQRPRPRRRRICSSRRGRRVVQRGDGRLGPALSTQQCKTQDIEHC